MKINLRNWTELSPSSPSSPLTWCWEQWRSYKMLQKTSLKEVKWSIDSNTCKTTPHISVHLTFAFLRHRVSQVQLQTEQYEAKIPSCSQQQLDPRCRNLLHPHVECNDSKRLKARSTSTQESLTSASASRVMSKNWKWRNLLHTPRSVQRQ